MIGSFDDDQLLRFRKRCHQRLQPRFGGELIARSAYEQLWLVAGLQEVVIVGAIVDGRDGRAEADERRAAVIGTRRSQADCGSEGEARETHRKMKFVVEPIKSGADVVDFAGAVVVLAVAQSGAAEV